MKREIEKPAINILKEMAPEKDEYLTQSVFFVDWTNRFHVAVCLFKKWRSTHFKVFCDLTYFGICTDSRKNRISLLFMIKSEVLLLLTSSMCLSSHRSEVGTNQNAWIGHGLI